MGWISWLAPVGKFLWNGAKSLFGIGKTIIKSPLVRKGLEVASYYPGAIGTAAGIAHEALNVLNGTPTNEQRRYDTGGAL